MNQPGEIVERERRDRWGYARYPDSLDELEVWDQVAAWPDDWIEGE